MSRLSSINDDKWSCAICTFVNSCAVNKCGMCSSHKNDFVFAKQLQAQFANDMEPSSPEGGNNNSNNRNHNRNYKHDEDQNDDDEFSFDLDMSPQPQCESPPRSRSRNNDSLMNTMFGPDITPSLCSDSEDNESKTESIDLPPSPTVCVTL